MKREENTNHQLSKGVVCASCHKIAYKPRYKAVTIIAPLEKDKSGGRITIDRVNLCDKFYLEKLRPFIKGMTDG